MVYLIDSLLFVVSVLIGISFTKLADAISQSEIDQSYLVRILMIFAFGVLIDLSLIPLCLKVEMTRSLNALSYALILVMTIAAVIIVAVVSATITYVVICRTERKEHEN